jgi:hypothetical protein
MFSSQKSKNKMLKFSINKILRDDHVLCALVVRKINQHEFRFFFANLCHGFVKQLFRLHTKKFFLYKNVSTKCFTYNLAFFRLLKIEKKGRVLFSFFSEKLLFFTTDACT